MTDFIYLFFYKIFSFFVNLLPQTFTNKLSNALASFAYTFQNRYNQRIFANLELAFPKRYSLQEKKQFALGVYSNLMQTILGIMKREKIKSKEALLEHITFENETVLTQALKENKKIIFITAHYSNWELLPPVLTANYDFTLTGIGRQLDSKAMDKILVKNRERFGVEMIYRKGALKNGIKALKKGKALGFLLDQSLGEKQGGIKVNFFGHPAGHSPAAATLARMFEDSITIPAFIDTQDYTHYTVRFYEPLARIETHDKTADILAMSQAQADIMQEVIKNRPEPWFWVHKRWKSYLPELYERQT